MMSKFFKRKVDTRDEMLGPILDTAARMQKSKDQFRRSMRDFRTRAAKCIEIDCGILKHLLWTVGHAVAQLVEALRYKP